MPSVEINWWAFIAAVAINLTLGNLWYSRGFLGGRWAKLIGRKHQDAPGNKSPGTVVPAAAILALITTFIMVHFIRYAGAITAVKGAEAGFWLWLGFIAAIMAAAHLFEGRSWKLWRINAGYWLVVFLINGALLAAWR